MNNPVMCPRCRKYHLIYRTLQRTGDVYAMCENYPQCSYVGDLEDLKPRHHRSQRQAG